MRLAMRLPEKRDNSGRNDADPREELSAEIIDLASRNSFPAITQRKKGSDALGLAAGVAVVALLGAVTLWGLNSSRSESLPGEQPQGAADVPPPVPAEAITDLVAPPPAATALAPLPDPAPAPVLANDPGLGLQPGLAVNPYATPTVVYDSSPIVQAAAPVAATDAPVPAAGGAGDFASRIGGVGGGPARAVSQFDPQTTVTQGTLIPAVLETAIDTDVPGYVRAVVSQDVKSFDGSKVLIPRSSRLIGEYKSATQAGQRRAYLMWTRLVRPDGVSIALASPAADFTGQAGVGGQVNTHFFSRFGSAILLSILGGAQTLATGGASTVVVSGGQSAAGAALQRDGNRGPTIKVRQGEPIRVFTARDLIFSSGEGAAG